MLVTGKPDQKVDAKFGDIQVTVVTPVLCADPVITTGGNRSVTPVASRTAILVPTVKVETKSPVAVRDPGAVASTVVISRQLQFVPGVAVQGTLETVFEAEAVSRTMLVA
jgi:hypothetical protein